MAADDPHLIGRTNLEDSKGAATPLMDPQRIINYIFLMTVGPVRSGPVSAAVFKGGGR